MSFLSGLAKFGLGLIPGVGGLLSEAVDPIANAITGAGSAVGKANTAAGQNRDTAVQNSLKANQQNIAGQSDYENELMARAKEDAAQRQSALKQLYMGSYAQNPSHSPYNPAGAPKYSPEYLAALKGLGTQATTRLANASPYDLSTTNPLAAYNPINIKDVAGSTGNAQGFLSKLGDWVSPALTVAGNAMKGNAKAGVKPQGPTPDNTINDEDYYTQQMSAAPGYEG